LFVYRPYPAPAAETAVPLLKFIPNWSPEKLFDVPAVQVAVCLLSWVIDDVALALVLGDGAWS
jgi:hypothetical protein